MPAPSLALVTSGDGPVTLRAWQRALADGLSADLAAELVMRLPASAIPTAMRNHRWEVRLAASNHPGIRRYQLMRLSRDDVSVVADWAARRLRAVGPPTREHSVALARRPWRQRGWAECTECRAMLWQRMSGLLACSGCGLVHEETGDRDIVRPTTGCSGAWLYLDAEAFAQLRGFAGGNQA